MDKQPFASTRVTRAAPLPDEVEARMMVELVDAWRDLEHRKHVALKDALADLLTVVQVAT